MSYGCGRLGATGAPEKVAKTYDIHHTAIFVTCPKPLAPTTTLAKKHASSTVGDL